MKILYLIILSTVISCAQKAKQEKAPDSLSQEELVNRALKTLDIDESKTDFIVSKVLPNNSKETIIVIPEVINEDEDVFELNGNIIIADNITGKQTHTLFESPKENGWISDAVFINEIAIDTLTYKLSDTDNAFGVIVSYRSGSQPNPYSSKTISLYKKENNSLKKVLDNYAIYESSGEVNLNVNECHANLKEIVNILSVADTINNGFYDILVTNTVSQIHYNKNEEGECNPIKQIVAIEDIELKFNGIEYKEVTRRTRKNIDTIDFNTAIVNINIRKLPLIDETDFDSFIDEDDYKNVDVKALKLKKIYPNFYRQGYNYRAIESYKIELSNNFHSVVITVLKGDNEMESVLVNYDLEGKIIDSQVISYDEIAEGMFKTESKISNSRVLVHQVKWEEEPKIEQVTHQVLDDGTINEIDSKVLNDEFSNFSIINIALEALNLNLLSVKTEFIRTETHPDNPDEFIVIVPEIVEESEHYLKLNSHILIVNGSSGEVTHRTVVKDLTSEGDEDVIKDIKIDTRPYIVNEHTHAFGILIYRYGNITVTPWENENLELFVKSGDTLNNILQNFNVMEYGGEIISDCEGGDTQVTRVLNFLTSKTNGYFDIMVKTDTVDSENFPDGNGECNTTEKLTIKTKLLKFNDKTYRYDKLQQ